MINDVNLEKTKSGDYKITYVVDHEELFKSDSWGMRSFEPLERLAFEKLVGMLAKGYFEKNYDLIMGKIKINSLVKSTNVKLAKDIYKETLE